MGARLPIVHQSLGRWSGISFGLVNGASVKLVCPAAHDFAADSATTHLPHPSRSSV